MLCHGMGRAGSRLAIGLVVARRRTDMKRRTHIAAEFLRDGRPSPHLRLTLTSSEEEIVAALRDVRDVWSVFPDSRGRRRYSTRLSRPA